MNDVQRHQLITRFLEREMYSHEGFETVNNSVITYFNEPVIAHNKNKLYLFLVDNERFDVFLLHNALLIRMSGILPNKYKIHHDYHSSKNYQLFKNEKYLTSYRRGESVVFNNVYSLTKNNPDAFVEGVEMEVLEFNSYMGVL